MKKYYVVNEKCDVIYRGVYDSYEDAAQELSDTAKQFVAINDGIMLRAATQNIQATCRMIKHNDVRCYHWSIGDRDYWLEVSADRIAFGSGWEIDHEGQANPKIDHEYKVCDQDMIDFLKDTEELPF